MTTSYWNWSWISSKEDTYRKSESVEQSGGILYNYRTATRGMLDASELKSFSDSVAVNINQQWNIWRTAIRPILDSLPSGERDTRWRFGQGLPSKIDALNYGVQGTTLFVFNDADSIKASGKYWHTTEERPITIAEAIENVWYAIDNLDISAASSSASADLAALWAAIGVRYYDSAQTSASTSLDARTDVLEGNINQLKNDLYGVSEGYSPWTFGTPLSHSVAKNIDYLLKLHNVASGWQSDPSSVSHGTFASSSHTHPYSDILPPPAASLTQDRATPVTTLEHDIKRLRYEIQQTRGSSSWYSDVTDPVTSSAGDLGTHIAYIGGGTPSSANPHGINYVNTGASTIFTNLARYTGMTSYISGTEYPTYSSTNYVTQSSNLETAIGELDAAIYTKILGFVTRAVYGPYDRSGLSETEKEQTPITITHNNGEEPVVQVLDLSPETQESWGMYSSPTTEYQIDYPDVNTIRIWTNADVVKVIALFGGGLGVFPPVYTTNDHGALDAASLLDDDHSQYLLVSGSRAMAGHLSMDGYQVRTTTGTLKFNDSYNAGSIWSQAYINLAASSSEWDDFETNFGEVSIFNALNQAVGSSSLTSTYVGYGSGTNELTGSANLTFNSNNQFLIGPGTPNYISTTNYSAFVDGILEVDSYAYFNDTAVHVSNASFLTSGTGLVMSASGTSDYLWMRTTYSAHTSQIKLNGDATVELEAVDLTAESGSAEVQLTARESGSTTSPQVHILSGGSYSGTLAGTLTLQAYSIHINAAQSVDYDATSIIDVGALGFTKQTPTITSGVLSSVDLDDGSFIRVAVSENITSVNVDGFATGNSRCSWAFDFSGSYTVTGFPASFHFVTGTTIPISGASGETWIVTSEYRDSVFYSTVTGPFTT